MKKLTMTIAIILTAAGLYASEVDRVLTKYGYNPNNVDYDKITQKANKGFLKSGSIETDDHIVNTKYEAALLLVFNDDNWLEYVLLIKEMQRVYPERADEFEKNIASIKKSKNVTDKQIEAAYIALLKQDFAKNKQLTFYIKGTTQLSPEASIILKYLVASPSERGQYKKAVIDMAIDITRKATQDGSGSPADVKENEFNHFLSCYKDIQDFILPEIEKYYTQN